MARIGFLLALWWWPDFSTSSLNNSLLHGPRPLGDGRPPLSLHWRELMVHLSNRLHARALARRRSKG